MTIEEAAVELIRKTKNHWVNARTVTKYLHGDEDVSLDRKREISAELKRLAEQGTLEQARREDGSFYTIPGEGTEYIPLRVRRLMMGGITPEEIEIAKRRVKIGDVFPAVVFVTDSSVNAIHPELADVVMDYKSKHLIHCTDGHTYRYAALAMYYRNRQPLERWER